MNMPTVYDATVRDGLISRINSLTPQHAAHWGKMNVYQMVKHCTLCEEMMQGKLTIKRVFIGRLIGKMILNKALKNDRPFGRNSPTSPILKTTSDSGDIEVQKKEWIKGLGNYAQLNAGFVHPFFGPMTKEQIGLFAYKHIDHHLRQFGV